MFARENESVAARKHATVRDLQRRNEDGPSSNGRGVSRFFLLDVFLFLFLLRLKRVATSIVTRQPRIDAGRYPSLPPPPIAEIGLFHAYVRSQRSKRGGNLPRRNILQFNRTMVSTMTDDGVSVRATLTAAPLTVARRSLSIKREKTRRKRERERLPSRSLSRSPGAYRAIPTVR